MAAAIAMFVPSAYAEPTSVNDVLTEPDSTAQTQQQDMSEDGAGTDAGTGDDLSASSDSEQSSDGATDGGQTPEDVRDTGAQSGKDAGDSSQEDSRSDSRSDADAEPVDDGQESAGTQDADARSNGGVATRDVDDSQYVTQGVSPRGTTINLFDYWITGRDDQDNSTPSNYQNLGINAGHALHFTWGGIASGTNLDGCNPNDWTNSAKPCFGIVDDNLVNGYPMLSDEVSSSASDKSLAYLFDTKSFDGKQAYTDVDGLLQVDQQGYYYYDSHSNFAQFDGDGNGSGEFTLYKHWGVTNRGTSPTGQFFPFNSGQEVFDEKNGSIEPKEGLKSDNKVINHYFGLTMSTRFVQQYGGHTAPDGTTGRQAVTYNFSGDDDVWIYIDGVLVGDLGGIHDAASLQIDFSSGDVQVYKDDDHDNTYDSNEQVYSTNTLKGLFHAEENDPRFTGDTFADNTYHTLDFFYLERGGYDSNMSLRYNLVNIPESGIVKVDQNGHAMSGVRFTLKQANSDYSIPDNAECITATTDENGQLIFTRLNGNGSEIPIALSELKNQSEYWVLHEETPPEGYRSAGDMHLYFSGGALLSSNHWDTGAYALPHVTAIAPTKVQSLDGSTSYDPADGTMFAVVFQKGDDNEWHPVYGEPYAGWTVSDGTDINAVVAAFKADPNLFTLGTGGAYETTIEDLPGDIKTYEYMMKNDDSDSTNPDNAKYSVRYYYSEAKTADGVDASNTYQIKADADNDYKGMSRIFSVTLEVPNIKNELKLVKTDVTDGANTPMAGVEFNLYKTQYASDGTPKAGTTHVRTLTTDEDGGLNVTTDGALLAKGDYMLVETTPKGYFDEDTAIHIIVDDSGVHVDAGDADDNVTVTTGLGTLVYSMKFFAAADKIDATLHDVKVTPETSDAYNGTYEPVTVEGAEVVYHYGYNGRNDDDLSYVEEDGTPSSFTAKSGWSRLAVTQCLEHGTENYKQDLQDIDTGVPGSQPQRLDALFTGDVTIRVTNIRAKGSLVIQKILAGRPWNGDDAFEFTVTPADNDNTGGVQDGSQTTQEAVAAGVVVLPMASSADGALGTVDNPVVVEDGTTAPGHQDLEHAAEYGDILFSRPGTYTFTVAEKTGSLPGVNYSGETFTVEFTVAEWNGADGTTVPVVTLDIGPTDDGVLADNDGTQYGVKFTNTFTSVVALPMTGGGPTGRAVLLAGGGVLLLAGLAWLLAKRRRD